MRSLNQIARTLSGRTRLEERAELASADTYTLIGVATTDSANGSVRIRLTDSVTRAGWDEEGTDIEVPTNGHVREGQRVYVTCFGGSMQEMVVSGAVGEGDELRADVNTALSEAEIAHEAADAAVEDAGLAKQAAQQAAGSAESAATSAANAASSASSAEADARRAEQSADSAQSSASTAATAASNAQTSAGQAAQSASDAQQSASTAADAAQQAVQDAAEAKRQSGLAQTAADTAIEQSGRAETAARQATSHANSALVQLSTVEDVIGTVNWIAEHGEYVKTTDTAIDPDKVYYVKQGDLYHPVAEPDVADISTYYELHVDDALSNFVASHLALTDAGLYVLKDADAWKTLVRNDGFEVQDPAGVAAISVDGATGIGFDANRPMRIGTDSAFIIFTPASGSDPATIQIGGANVQIGGLAPSELAGSRIWTATADPTTPNYTFARSALTGASGAPRVGDLVVRGYYRYTVSSVATSTVLTGNRTSIRGATGAQGPQGPQGEQGPQGAAGHSPEVTSTKNADGSVTILVDGTATSTVDAGEDGHSPSVTTTKNSDGSVTIYVDGTVSSTVEAGKNGTSYYTYVRYSKNANGSGMVTTPTAETKYIGVYTGTSSSVPAYTSFNWSKYVGDDAAPLTVTATSVDYILSTSGTNPPADSASWQASPLAPTTTQYLWTRTTLTFSDGTTAKSYSIGGKVGEKGSAGPEAYVTITPSNIDWAKKTATLTATLHVNGAKVTSGVTYAWAKGDTALSTTTASCGITDLNATYSCTCTWSGGKQRGTIDFAASNSVKLAAEAGWKSDLGSYYTKTEVNTTVNGINQKVSGVETKLTTISNPNLTPWFSVSVDNTDYWKSLHCRNTSITNSEGLHGIWDGEDGWAHVTLDSRTSAGNDGSRACYMNMHVAHPKIADRVTEGGTYTWLVEVRNLTWVGASSADSLRVCPSVGNATLDVFSSVVKTFTADSAQYGVVTAKTDFSVLTMDTRGYCYIPTGCYADFDLRISLYEGTYTGPYKPYVEQSLTNRVSQAETSIEQTANNVLIKATKSDTTAAQGGQHLIQSLINVAPDGVKIAADKVNIEGAAIFTSGRLSSTSLNNSYDAKGAASTAETNAKAYTDSVEIGGRNLFKSTTECVKAGTGTASISAYDYSYHGRTVTVTAASPVMRINNIITETNVPYTISFTCTASAACKVQIDVMDNAAQYANVPAGTSKVAITSTPTRAVDSTYHFIDILFSTAGTYKLADIMVEQSNKASSWSLAPEDMAIERTCTVGQNSSTTTNPWYRVASSLINSQYVDNILIVDVYDSGGYTTTGVNFGKRGGRLVAHARAGQGITSVEAPYLVWESRGSEVNLSDFVLAYKLTSGSRLDIELWCRCANSYQGYVFKVVYEGHRAAAPLPGLWVLYSSWAAGSSASITSGYTQVVSTDGSAAQETANANVKRTQRIYYRKATVGAPGVPTAWVVNGNVESSWTKYNAWSTRVPPIADSTSSTTKYLYLYTCEQYETAGGTTPQYTTVLLDDSTTIIDGGNIITGSIAANRLSVYDATIQKIRADAIDTKSISIGDLTGSIGGRNILHGTRTMTAGDGKWNSTRTFRASGGTLSNVTTSGLPIQGVSGALRITNTGTSTASQIGFAQDGVSGLIAGETYTQGAWVRASTTMNIRHQPIWKSNTQTLNGTFVSVGTSWQYISFTGTLSGAQADYYNAGYMYAQNPPAGAWFEVCGLKLEKSSKGTDWTPAPEDVDSEIEQSIAGHGGFDILWNRVAYDSDENAGGECYICAYDPTTAIRSNANGWVMWNGVKRTIPRGAMNPNSVVPFNIPVYIVCRLSSATSTTGTMYMVWYNSGWKYAVTPTPSAVGGTWTWAEATDMVIGKFVEPGAEQPFTECETYRQPLKWGTITTDTVTARSAQSAANSAAKTATSYLTDITSGGLMVHPSSDANTGVRITDKVDIQTANKVMNRIDTSGMTLYDGAGVAASNVVAKFASNLIELGKNSRNAVINMCNDVFSIAFKQSTEAAGFTHGLISSLFAIRVRSGTENSERQVFGSVEVRSDQSVPRAYLQSRYHVVSGGSEQYAQASVESQETGSSAGFLTRTTSMSVGDSAGFSLTTNAGNGKLTFSNSGELNIENGFLTIGGSIKAIYADSTVVQLSNGKWLSLANATTVAQKLGSGASQTNTICIAQNGGFESYSGVVTGAMGSDGSARAYIYPNHTGYIRVNFILIRFA